MAFIYFSLYLVGFCVYFGWYLVGWYPVVSRGIPLSPVGAGGALSKCLEGTRAPLQDPQRNCPNYRCVGI